MDEIVERFNRITGQFSDRVREVSPQAWSDPSPCEGWTARDVVAHLTEWIPGFFGTKGVTFPPIPSVDEDPAGAWEVVRSTLAEVLADPALASLPVETPFGTQGLADTVDQIVIGDVFAHTWDLARATGQDETLDPDYLRTALAGLAGIPDEALRSDGMFGPAVEVADDADEQTRYLAHLGRKV